MLGWFTPGVYLASHPLLAYGVMAIVGSTVVSGPYFVIVWGPFALLYHFSLWHVLVIAIAGDCINDSILYWLGRSGNRLTAHLFKQRGHRTPPWLERVHDSLYNGLNTHPFLSLFSAKSIPFPGAGSTLIGTVGLLRFPYARFVLYCASISVFWMTTLVSLVGRYGMRALRIDPYVERLVFSALVTVLAARLLFSIFRFAYKMIVARIRAL